MRISDIDVIRGDAQTQKPYVAFGADTTYDAPEPYGEWTNEATHTIVITESEKEYLTEILHEKRKVYNHSLKQSNPRRKAFRETSRKRDIVHSMLDKLKGGTNP